tara:strand:- start:12053 stop:13789 length:1737 start_codon:yes stop_codon:yes gene_type:complete
MNKILLILLIVLGLPLVFQSTPTEILKLKTFDYLVPEKEPSGYFTILNITEKDIDNEGGYPIPRARLAEIQRELIRNGAIGVGWVISFPHPDRMGGDQVFGESLKQGTSILAMFEAPNQIYPETVGTVILGDNNGGMLSKGVVQNTPNLRYYAQEGIATAPTDVDNLVRKIPLLLRTPEGYVPSFGTEVLKALVEADTYVIKTNDLGIEEIRVKGLPPIKTDSYGRKWISWVKTPETTLEEMDVEGKFVFVGITAPGVMPQIATPAGLLEPHKIQAALSESILIPDSPYIPDWALAAEILIFLIFVSLIWLVINFMGTRKGLGMVIIIMGSTGFTGFYIINKGILLDFSYTLASEFITASVAYYINFRKQYLLRQQTKKQFEHYLDPRQVKILQDNPELLKLGGERKYCTFMFTDVRNFTSMSESLSPEEVTKLMNKVLTIQSDCVKFYDGCIDKFIGDAGFFVFNAPLPLEKHEEAAVLCAIEMQDKMKSSGLGVEIGVGICSGEAVQGNLGSQDRFDWTSIGMPVNQAARLESSTKTVGENILISESTAKKCDFELKLLEPIKVKGVSKPLNIYTV